MIRVDMLQRSMAFPFSPAGVPNATKAGSWSPLEADSTICELEKRYRLFWLRPKLS
jgi:hypothetical protein